MWQSRNQIYDLTSHVEKTSFVEQLSLLAFSHINLIIKRLAFAILLSGITIQVSVIPSYDNR